MDDETFLSSELMLIQGVDRGEEPISGFFHLSLRTLLITNHVAKKRSASDYSFNELVFTNLSSSASTALSAAIQ